MTDFYRSESINSSETILSTGLPKKSKAQSKNVNKLKKFFYTTITNVLSGEYRSSASIVLTISKLNQRKDKINENSEKAINKVYDEYANKVANSPDSDISYLQQKRNESENEITDVRDSKLASIDSKIAHYQEILDKKSGVSQILEDEERRIGEEVSAIENNTETVNEPIVNQTNINSFNQEETETSELTEEDRKNLERFKTFVYRNSPKPAMDSNQTENTSIELEPISENLSNNQEIQPEITIENQEIQPEITIENQEIQPEITIENQEVQPEIVNNNSENEMIKPIEEKENAPIQQSNSDKKHSEIKELERKYLDDVASIREKMNSEVSSVIASSLAELEKTYKNYYQNQIKMFSNKTSEVIEKANNEVIKEKNESLKIAADRDQYKSHYEQAIETVKNRDNIIADKDQEIAALKSALEQANNYVAESSKREEAFKNELAASKNTIERYKQVVESFATVGTMQSPISDEVKSK